MVAESAEEMQVCRVACLTAVWSGGSVEGVWSWPQRRGDAKGKGGVTAEGVEKMPDGGLARR